MSFRRRAAAFLLLAALVGEGTRAGAQTVALSISSVTGDSVSPAPIMSVSGFDNRPDLAPYSVSIVLSLEPQFRSPFYINAADGETATFALDSLLPERTVVYFRARLSDRNGTVVAEQIVQHPVRGWLRLVAPLRGPTTIVPTRTPRFIWSSPPITLPPGLWVYDISVINTRTGNVDFVRNGLNDTSYVFPDSLESNASYHWQVHARAQTGPAADQVTVTSSGTFVIAASPTATVFYANFPNPFGGGTKSALTCFWFDLARPAAVKLTIYDIRLREVRKIIPSSSLNGTLSAGAYGRDNVNALSGCDERVAWDGRDANGGTVPPGVYLGVFDGDGVHRSTKILFKGP
ncbi:MAG: hypothetical protein ABI442_22655 [Gemmatimonadaceae bacterium]